MHFLVRVMSSPQFKVFLSHQKMVARYVTITNSRGRHLKIDDFTLVSTHTHADTHTVCPAHLELSSNSVDEELPAVLPGVHQS